MPETTMPDANSAGEVAWLVTVNGTDVVAVEATNAGDACARAGQQWRIEQNRGVMSIHSIRATRAATVAVLERPDMVAHRIASEVARRLHDGTPATLGRGSIYNLVREVAATTLDETATPAAAGTGTDRS